MKKILALVLVLAVCTMMFSACGNSSKTQKEDTASEAQAVGSESQTEQKEDNSKTSGKETGKVYTIGYAPTTMNNPFWLAVLDGVKEVLEPLGHKIVTIDCQNDQSKMNDQVGDLIASGIDALLIAPVDSTGCQPALEACKEKNIPVINFDTPVANADMVASIVASDNYNAGVVVAKDMLEKLQEGSKVAVLHSPSGQACIDRYAGFTDTIGDKLNVVSVLDGKGDTGVSLPLAEDILTADPDLGAFFAVNDPSAIGCIQALAAHPEAKGVLVYGVDGSPDAKTMIKKGDMTGTGAQSPETMGAKSAETALSVLAGKEVEKHIVVDTFLITSKNVEEYGLDTWQ